MRTRLLHKLLIRAGIWKAGKEVQVESSVIKAISYDRRHEALVVTFNNGSIYKYGCVAPRTAREFVAADSKGKFFNKQIRNSKDYPYRLVGRQEPVNVG